MLGSFHKYKVVYSYLWRTYGSSWTVRLSFILQFITRIFKLVIQPILVSMTITRLSQHDFQGAYEAVAWFILAVIVYGIMIPLTKYLALGGEQKWYGIIVRDYFQKLVSSDLEYFNSHLSGYLTTATRQFVDNTLILVRSVRDTYLNTVLSILFPLGVILYLNRLLGGITLLLTLILATYLFWSSKKIDPLRHKSREIYKHNSGKMADVISNILAVKSTAQEHRLTHLIHQDSKAETNAFLERYKLQIKFIAAREAITVIFFAGLLLFTVSLMSSEKVGLPTAILVITYITTILLGINSLSENQDDQDDLVDKILPGFELLGRENKVGDPKKPKRFAHPKGNIKLSNITFAYENVKPNSTVLSNFSLHIPTGQKLGVVGLSGAGKSTLTKLLLRFVDTDSGTVEIDGVDVRLVKQSDLRRNIAYVPQEPMLFHSSIKENVLLANPNAKEQEVKQALKAAHALDFIQALPEGLDSIVGERGVKLSGGQKQRIAIARAVLQDAPIVILDEATSALDSESEQIIKSSFAEIFKNKTAIVVAHRLSTLSDMDRIVVIDHGKLLEDGTHEELLKKGGLYANLWQRQLHHKET